MTCTGHKINEVLILHSKSYEIFNILKRESDKISNKSIPFKSDICNAKCDILIFSVVFALENIQCFQATKWQNK